MLELNIQEKINLCVFLPSGKNVWHKILANILELVSKELNHFGGIAWFFRDWVPGTLTGGAYTKVYLPPVSVPAAQSREKDAIPPKWFNSLGTNSSLHNCFTNLLPSACQNGLTHSSAQLA